MLSWIVGEQGVVMVTEGQKVSAEDIRALQSTLSMKLTDGENVNLRRIKKYFEKDAWQLLLDILQDMQHDEWMCAACHENLMDCPSVGCDSCLDWYHMKCCGLSKTPKCKVWICRTSSPL